MFKRSNVTTLIMEQLKDVEGCLINFENFMRAAGTPEAVPETLRALESGVVQMEAAADRSLSQMIESLGQTPSLLPATRQDLITIGTSCDSVANKCEHLAMMMVMQNFRFPTDYKEDIKTILSVTHEQFELLQKSVQKLFAKFNELSKDHSILYEIRDLETKVDKIELKLFEDAYSRTDIDLAHQQQLAYFIETLCDLSDIIENIADKIQIMLITRKA